MTVRYVLLLFLFCSVGAVYGQPSQADPVHLKKTFKLATARDFQLLDDRIVEHDDKWRGGPYMLFHVKPKQSGIYKLKYTYRMRDDFYYEGENEVVIRVGGRRCDRDLQTDDWKTMFCLGDTVIIPVRLRDSSNHAFTLESTYQKPAARTGGQRSYFPGILNKEKVTNPLEANLKYLGFDRSDQLSRSATSGGTISHKAFFEAQTPGKFNMGLSTKAGDEPGNTALNPVPVIIVAPGTAITALVPHERVTGYTKGRAYSSGNLISYRTNLLILQPGDVISETYSLFIIERGSPVRLLERDPIPVILKQPFSLKKDGSYNDWIAGYLP